MQETSKYTFEVTIRGNDPLNNHNIFNRLEAAVRDRIPELEVMKFEQTGKDILLLNTTEANDEVSDLRSAEISGLGDSVPILRE